MFTDTPAIVPEKETAQLQLQAGWLLLGFVNGAFFFFFLFSLNKPIEAQ